ncbi:MAG: hypothetical protein AAF937_01700 [Planctomycetota bacterium]
MATASRKRGVPQLSTLQREANASREHFGIAHGSLSAPMSAAESERRFGRSRWAWRALARSDEIASEPSAG